MEIAPYTIAAPASTSASARMKERRSRAIEFYRKESEPNCISERHSSSIEKPHRLDGEYRGQYSRRGESTPQLPEAIAFDGLQVSHRNVAGACQSEGASWSRRDKKGADRSRRPLLLQPSDRGVSKELAARGFFNELGKPYAAKSVASMLR